MSKQALFLTAIMTLAGSALSPVMAAEQKVTLMLGGKFCDLYLGEVSNALTKIDGVKNVDLKSMKGHAIVTIDGEKTKPAQLAKAVNGVKGDGWHCAGEVMK
ncbi:MAG TPA: heavy-metal-associated domain-containing protein [Nitrospiraceae bacterium]|nr:heavy-metal-associated domain-containing protein [Nitrospiraceae bacterium]